MTRPLIQIDDEVREMTDEEFAQHKAILAETAAKEADAQAKSEAKAALLERLGITAEEAALLIS
jgi:hypothetical protein